MFGESPSQKHRNGDEVSPSDNLPASNLRTFSLSPSPTSNRKQVLSSSLHFSYCITKALQSQLGDSEALTALPPPAPHTAIKALFANEN